MSDKLLPCPFCGGEADMTYIGNDRTKSRKITVKCKNEMCRNTQTNGAIRFGFDWIREVCIAAWNRRFVCHDKYGVKVYVGDRAKAADCEGTVDRLGGIVIESEDHHLHHVWPSEIELIKEPEE